MSLAPPDISTKRDLGRKLFDAFLAQVPLVGGPLAAIYSVTYPAKGEIELDRWRHEISMRVADAEKAVQYIADCIPLSENAAFLGRWMSSNSRDGRSDIFMYEQILAPFPEASVLEVQEAVGELELEGMLSISKCLGKPFSHVRPHFRLFEAFDPIVFDGINPRADAASLAEELLISERGMDVHDAALRRGWSPRRINPAISIVGSFVAEGRKSQELGQPYAIRAIFVDATERAILRRFVNEVGCNTGI